MSLLLILNSEPTLVRCSVGVFLWPYCVLFWLSAPSADIIMSKVLRFVGVYHSQIPFEH